MTIITPAIATAGYEMREASGAHRDVTQQQGVVDFAGRRGGGESAADYWGKDGFGFDDFIDIVNPMQHIPIVNNIYRALTGDQLSHGARMVGGTLFGGPLGFAAALANSVVEDSSGKDIGGNLIAFFSGDDAGAPTPQNNTTMMADMQQSPTPTRLADHVMPAAAPPVPGESENNAKIAVAMAPAVAKAIPASAPVESTAYQHAAARQAALQPTPHMTNASFNALMKSIGATPAVQTHPAPGWKFGAVPALRDPEPVTANMSAAVSAPPPAAENGVLASPKLHREGLEMHQMLSKFYQLKTDTE
jgi:hypothetical protein